MRLSGSGYQLAAYPTACRGEYQLPVRDSGEKHAERTVMIRSSLVELGMPACLRSSSISLAPLVPVVEEDSPSPHIPQRDRPHRHRNLRTRPNLPPRLNRIRRNIADWRFRVAREPDLLVACCADVRAEPELGAAVFGGEVWREGDGVSVRIEAEKWVRLTAQSEVSVDEVGAVRVQPEREESEQGQRWVPPDQSQRAQRTKAHPCARSAS